MPENAPGTRQCSERHRLPKGGLLARSRAGEGWVARGLAGFAATAVAYGPARTGYGLFAPDFREEFGLSTGTVGVVGSGLQAGFLLALVATALLVARLGPRLLHICAHSVQ